MNADSHNKEPGRKDATVLKKLLGSLDLEVMADFATVQAQRGRRKV